MSDARELDIEEQPLSDALRTVADEFGLQIAFFSESTDGLQAEPLIGTYTPDRAFDVLLEDTALVHTQLDNGTVIVQAGAGIKATRPGKPRPASNPVLMAQNQAPAPRNQTNERTDEDDGNEEPKPRKLEEILVTGSRIRGAQIASSAVTITRQEIRRGGFATTEQLVENLPQNFDAGANLGSINVNQQNAVGGIAAENALAGGNSVNLRGLGARSTLILVNGHRISPSGLGANFTNVSSIPVTAIKRVEVLTDAASAIYGSDAIAGVINFILRDDFEGAETRLRYGSDSRGDTSNIQVGQSLGQSWDGGNVLFTYEYFESANLSNRDRAVAASADLRPFGGTDHRAPGGNPANIRAGGQLWAIPPGQDGTSLTPANFPVDANGVPTTPVNLYDEREFGDLLPEFQRHSAYLHLTHETGLFDLFADARFSSQDLKRLETFGFHDFVVTDANPFFVDPTGSGLTTVEIVDYSFDFPLVRFGEISSFGAVLGVQFDIGEKWDGEIAANWSREDAVSGIKTRVNDAALDVALNPTDPNPDPSLVFNPFADGPATDPSVIESFIDRSRHVLSDAENELQAVSLNVDGPLFGLPGGAAQLATGIQYREESLLATNNFIGLFTSDLGRNITSVYAEFFLPFVSTSNRQPGVQRLEISVAGRYSRYSDFGDSIDPKVGIVWSPTSSLAVRGTYGSSFRAPALADLDVANPDDNAVIYLPQFLADVGLIPYPFIVRLGGNEDLQAEEATTWAVGFQWRPDIADGVSLDVTYFNVDFENRIANPVVNLFTGPFEPRARTLLNEMPTDAQIAALVNSSLWTDIFGVPKADILSGTAPVGAIFDDRLQNLARSIVTGLDLQLAYRFETGLGSFDVGLNSSYLFDFERKLITADPLVDEVDTYGRPVDFRARGSVTWGRGGWNVTGFVNYVDSYTDNFGARTTSTRPVDSWTAVDLSIIYDTGDNSGLFSDTRLSLSAHNLFDEAPPFVDTRGGLGFDSLNANALGTTLAVQLTKEW